MKMVQSKKFRGVRQRHWGSWVSEIRHPLLKRRVWLGTFETAEEAARTYDQAAILMSGRNAKTNFPVSQAPTSDSEKNKLSPLSPKSLSEILHAKLRKFSKTPSPSMTCLRLDNENSHIGVWQKRAGQSSISNSNWVMTVEFGKKNPEQNSSSCTLSSDQLPPLEAIPELPLEMSEEARVALQMIEELLIGNNPSPSIQCHEEDAVEESCTDLPLRGSFVRYLHPPPQPAYLSLNYTPDLFPRVKEFLSSPTVEPRSYQDKTASSLTLGTT